MEFTVGLSGEATTAVNDNNTAEALGSGDLKVFATPAMVALMEKAATNAIKAVMPSESTSVGTMINVRHVAATPVGMKVTAVAKLVEVDGKRLVFDIEARDEREIIGEGRHERFVVNAIRFMDRTGNKL